MTNRREFLQSTAAIAGSLVLPKQSLAHLPNVPLHSCRFLHIVVRR